MAKEGMVVDGFVEARWWGLRLFSSRKTGGREVEAKRGQVLIAFLRVAQGGGIVGGKRYAA